MHRVKIASGGRKISIVSKDVVTGFDKEFNPSRIDLAKGLPVRPDFNEIEARWQKLWEETKTYTFNRRSNKKVFSIDTPPPTVSGDLHMGHAMSYTHFDVIGRYKRMRGFNVLQPLGFDDNGHPTETFVEKQHEVYSKDMPKGEFNALVMKEIPKLESEFKRDFIELGHAYDWSITYSTISSDCQKIAQLSFIDLFKKKLAYREEAPTIWCTRCQTALSQADLDDEERETRLNYLYFSLEDNTKLEIATTRPELLPACVGIFVNQEDVRYSQLIGKKAKVPLFDYWVETRTDSKVDPNFGTGAVMVCTFGDKTDMEWWRKHKLSLRVCITNDGKLNHLAGKFNGMKLLEAREAILEELKGLGLLEKQESLKQIVSVCWRCSTPVEFMVTRQWFIEVLKHKKKFIELGRKIAWHPAYYRKLYENWVKNLGWDWLISRQRHFGVPIPAWYCRKCGEVILPSEKDLPVDPEKVRPKKECRCGSTEFEPEHDVFDTWMTSSLTPQLILGRYNKRFGEIFPFTLRPSGRDIIRNWEFYTIVKSWYHFKSLPWVNVLISGMVYDPHGEEMHKSKGNAIAPQGVIKKYCADAFRYWTISSEIGESLWYQEDKIVYAKKLLVKLWNAARFIVPHLKKEKAKLKTADSWILAKLNKTLNNYIKAFDNYDPTTAVRALEQFFMHEFCDFYLEMVKYRIYGSDSRSKLAAQSTLYDCFLTLLKMWAPIFPHITEEIYQTLFKPEKSIHTYEIPTPKKVNKEALELGDLACEAISAIRKYKQSKNMSLGAELEVLILTSPKAIKLKKWRDDIAGTMRIKDLEIKRGKELAVIY